jgi:S1-C subfamily serine protease
MIKQLPIERAQCAAVLILITALAALHTLTANAADLVQTIASIKPAVVGVGTFIKTRSPAFHLTGSGFAVADGLHVITTAHTYAKPLDSEKRETPMVVVSAAGEPQLRDARIVAIDKEHDLALLRISGDPLRRTARWWLRWCRWCCRRCHRRNSPKNWSAASAVRRTR